MLFRKLLPVLAAAAAVSPTFAHAQFGVYGMVTGGRFGGVNCPSFAAPCAAGGGHSQNYGGTFGALYEFHTFGPVRLAADLRGDLLTSNKRADSSAGGAGIFRQYDVMGGVRGTFPTPIPWVHPYAEILVGYTRNNANGVYTQTLTTSATQTTPATISSTSFNPSVYSSQPMFKGVAGVDVTVSPHLDLRPFEIGLGEAFGTSNTVLTTNTTVSASGTTSTSSVTATSPGTHGIASIGAGLVLRF